MITEISAALTALKAAIDIADVLKNSTSSLKDAEMKLKLADLIGKLADTKLSMAEIQTLLLEKDETINSLEKSLKLKEKLEFDGAIYWLPKETGGKDGPFCQQCFDNDDKIIRLQYDDEYKHEHWYCLTCSNNYFSKSHT